MIGGCIERKKYSERVVKLKEKNDEIWDDERKHQLKK